MVPFCRVIGMSLRKAFDRRMWRNGHAWPFVLASIVLFLSVLIFLANAAIAQNPSPAFFELRPERVDAMLLPVPKDNDRRYARLRGFFTDLHCTRALMQEQAIHERSEALLNRWTGAADESRLAALGGPG